jgi:hypothetical protein
MKKSMVIMAVIFLVAFTASLVLAAESKTGTIKSVDAKSGSVVFCEEDGSKYVTLKADKSVDLGAVKAGEKVRILIDRNMLTHIMLAPAPKASVGC